MIQILQTFGIPDLVAFLSAVIAPLILVFDLWLFLPSFFTLDIDKKFRFAFSLPISLSILIGCLYTSKLYFDLRSNGSLPSYQDFLLSLDYTSGLTLIYIIAFAPVLFLLVIAVEKFSDISNYMDRTGEAHSVWQGILLAVLFAPILLLARFLSRSTWIPDFLFGESIKFWEFGDISAIFSPSYPLRFTLLINRITSNLGIQNNIAGTVVFVAGILGIIVNSLKIYEHFYGENGKTSEKKDDDNDDNLIPELGTFDSSSYSGNSEFFNRFGNSHPHPSLVDETDIDDDDMIDDYKGGPVPRTMTDSEFKIYLEQQRNKKDKAI